MANAATGVDFSKSRYRLLPPVRHMNHGPWIVKLMHSRYRWARSGRAASTRLSAVPLGLLGGQRDPVQVLLADVRHLEAEAPVQDDALHAFGTEFSELIVHLVGVELAVQEPERQDPE